MQIPWYLAALGAALIWGIHYPLIDNALRRVSLISVLLLTALPIVAIAPLYYKSLLLDIQVFKTLTWGERLPILALGLTSLAASVLLFSSIGAKNATLASLIEISYPLFVAVFSYVLFRHTQVTPSVFVGGMLVFAGIAVIVINNP